MSMDSYDNFGITDDGFSPASTISYPDRTNFPWKINFFLSKSQDARLTSSNLISLEGIEVLEANQFEV
jgi:hypothetical protein